MKALWFSARFVALAAVLFPAFFLPPLRSLCGGLAARVAALALSATSDATLSGAERASGSFEIGPVKIPRGRIEVRSGGASGRTAGVETFDYLRNVPLFWAALIAAAPQCLRRGRPGRMLLVRLLLVGAAGSLALLLLDGLVVASAAGEALANTPSHVSVPLKLNAGYQVLAVLAVLHTTGGLFVAPVFLGALAGLTICARTAQAQTGRTETAARAKAAAGAPAGRNDPCPCGSGLKFKRCCGR